MRALLIVVLVAACKPAPAGTPFTLRIAVSGPLDPVSPRADLRSWTSIAVPIVFEPLLNLGPQGEIVPVLAARAEVSGGSELRVWLRPEARFSDGSAMTAADVEESLAASGLRASTEGDHLRVTSSEAGVPTELLVSRAYVFRRAGAGYVGTGAFKVDEEDPSHILLSRIEPAPGFIGQVRVDSYPTGQDAFARTLKGDADMLPEVQPRWVEFFEGVPRLRILRGPGPSANMVAFNRKNLSKAERAALTGLLSNDDLRQLAFGEDCAPPARRPEIEPLPPGRPLDVLAVSFLERGGFAVRRALGPRAGSVEAVEVPEFLARVNAGDFDLALVRPRVWPPMLAVLNWRTGASTNLLHYSNPAVDAALDARDWAAAERALEEDPPGAIVCTPPAIVVLDARIRNASLAASFKESLPKWEVSP